MSTFLSFAFAAVLAATPLLFGALGEILTEKSGNLNLGVEGMMFMGGVAGLAGTYYYEKAVGEPNAIVSIVIGLVCAFLCAAFGALIYSVLTITFRANQNVTGLASPPSAPASATSSAKLWATPQADTFPSALSPRRRSTTVSPTSRIFRL